MIGLDTNVMVRYITQDDPAQSTAAAKLMDSLSSTAPGFVAMVVVVELVWALQGPYRRKQDEIVRVLEALLRSKELIVERAELVWQALRKFNAGPSDFADCLIERCAHAAECQYTVTFDRDAAKGTGMKLLR